MKNKVPLVLVFDNVNDDEPSSIIIIRMIIISSNDGDRVIIIKHLKIESVNNFWTRTTDGLNLTSAAGLPALLYYPIILLPYHRTSYVHVILTARNIVLHIYSNNNMNIINFITIKIMIIIIIIIGVIIMKIFDLLPFYIVA